MTSKIKCPFCGEKLYRSDNCYVCLNDQCVFCDFHFMEKRWNAIIELKQALIHTKKQLDRAKWWLKEIVENHRYAPISTAEMALKELDDEQ